MSTAETKCACPKVSIGLPVFNGERFIGDAVESILRQSFQDFELIVVDNASTDSTVAIMRGYEAKDSRIRLFVNNSNIGAAENFNRVLELARGEYFKWAAHDDLIEPKYLARCVAALESKPDAVLAYPKTIVMDEEGGELYRYDLELATDSPDATERFNALLGNHLCFQVFGLIRRTICGQTLTMGGYSHGDGVLLARLALLGPFTEIPQYDFRARRHQSQSLAMLDDRHAYAMWFNPRLTGKLTFPTWKMQWEFFRSIWSAPIGVREKLQCFVSVLNWTWMRRSDLRRDITYHIRLALERLTDGKQQRRKDY